jgi:hypothetical protein
MPTRQQPLIRIDLFQNGAEPYFGPGSDRGSTWYSVLSREAKFGTVSQATGILGPALEYLGTDRVRSPQGGPDIPIGLVLRPYIIPQDIGTWTALSGLGGTWQTIRSYINPPVLRLVQTYPGVNAAGTTTVTPWGRKSDYDHPADVILAFSVLVASVAPDYVEATGGVPYVQVSWSGGLWGIRFLHRGNPILVKRVAGLYIPLMELQQPPMQTHGDIPEETVCIVRVQRGALLVSLDGGATYDAWRNPDGTAVTLPAGNYQLTGLGCAASLGVHQAAVFTGTFDSARFPTGRTRSGGPTINWWGAEPTNADLAVTSLATASDAFLQYRATLTRGSITAHWTYFTSPELYVVELYHRPIPSDHIPTNDGGATFEGRIIHCVVDEPDDLDQSSCSWTARYSVSEGGPVGQFALRKVRVWGGWLYDDGSNDLRLMFTGWITAPAFTQQVGNFIEAQFTAESVALRPKRMRYRDDNCRPFDGLTLSTAFSRWLEEMGLDDTYGVANAAADAYTIPAEFPEEPAYLPASGDQRWPLLSELFRAGRMELAVTRDGRFVPVLADTWNFTANTWAGDPVDVSGRMESVTYEQDVMATCTQLTVRGQTPFGEQLSATVRDATAEEDVFSSRFRPWPEPEVLTIEYPVSRAWVNVVAQGEAHNHLVPQFPATWRGELAHAIQRRDSVYVTETSVGMGAVAQVGVRTMRHTFDIDSAAKWETDLSGDRL